MTTEEVARAYLHALESNDAAALVVLLGGQPRFVSPFSVWSTPDAVAEAYTARSSAFSAVAGVSVLASNGHAVIRWRGVVGDRDVEGVDVLTIGAGRVRTIDVFLRPADALDAVYAAMAAAWPRRSPGRRPG